MVEFGQQCRNVRAHDFVGRKHLLVNRAEGVARVLSFSVDALFWNGLADLNPASLKETQLEAPIPRRLHR